MARGPRGLVWWQAIPAGALAAIAVNLLILLIGTAADASLRLPDGDSVHTVTAGGVVVSSAVPLAAGTGLAVLLSLWRAAFLRIAQITGGALGAASLAGPLSADTDGGTSLALALMHLVATVSAVAALEAVRRHRTNGAA
ncbi:DUF6069 family protein [Streptomyces aidingensis]|uniref:DUF6069 family protein n=1 Tax=Streptomyces aidingensis TaxID=910347 RepID=UPI000B846C18|nr:DUF6069 family protein [Streptomyces aidingensis]